MKNLVSSFRLPRWDAFFWAALVALAISMVVVPKESNQEEELSSVSHVVLESHHFHKLQEGLTGMYVKALVYSTVAPPGIVQEKRHAEVIK